VQISIGLPE